MFLESSFSLAPPLPRDPWSFFRFFDRLSSNLIFEFRSFRFRLRAGLDFDFRPSTIRGRLLFSSLFSRSLSLSSALFVRYVNLESSSSDDSSEKSDPWLRFELRRPPDGLSKSWYEFLSFIWTRSLLDLFGAPAPSLIRLYYKFYMSHRKYASFNGWLMHMSHKIEQKMGICYLIEFWEKVIWRFRSFVPWFL